MTNTQFNLKFTATEQEIEERIKYLGLMNSRDRKSRVQWKNPYVAGKPIRTRKVFVGREDIFKFIKDSLTMPVDGLDVDDRNLIALFGHRRTGKTSLLLQLKKNRKDILAPRIPIFIDVEGMLPFRGGVRNFFYKIAATIKRTLQEEDIILPDLDEEQFKDPAWRFQEFLYGAIQAVGKTGFVLMMDEFQLLEPRLSSLDVDVYKMLRSIIQHNPHIDFIVAGTMQMEELMRQYQAAMFGSALIKRIDFLEEWDARKLISEPVSGYISYTRDAQDLIIAATASHPYFVQLVCWSLTRYLIERGKSRVFAYDVERVLPQVLEQGVHFDEIWATDTTIPELYIMAAVGELAGGRGKSCSISAIERKLRDGGYLPKDFQNLDEPFDNLLNRRILRNSDDGTEVCFHVGIFGDWVKVNKPLAVVKRDIQVEAAKIVQRAKQQPLNR